MVSTVNQELPLQTAVHDGSIRGNARLPGESGVWVLICGDLMVFSLFFLTFIVYRNGSPTLYSQSQNLLNWRLGVVNTFLLLTSSWFVAMAVRAARRESAKRAPLLLALAFLCGAGFVGVKILEYHERLTAGPSIAANEFFMFYFMFTGIHLLHVLIGLGVLLWLRHKTLQPDSPTTHDMALIESGATFWHLVDMLWIILFALLYLVR